MRQNLVIIGNGMAAARLVGELTDRAPGRYSITVVGAEPGLAYNRVLLSSVLAGEMAAAELDLQPATWWRARGVTVLSGHRAEAIDPASRIVRLAGGTELPYAALVLATGSHPIRLPVPGMDLPGVMTFRDLADVSALREAAKPGSRAIVIGGGLLGLEAATGLALAGAQTTVIHLMDRLMERQLDARAGALLRNAVEARGIAVRLGASTAAIEGDGKVEALRLADGTRLPADLVVVACGVRPNADLARAAGLACNRGVLVDDRLATSDPHIFALGECAEHRGIAYGLVEPAYQQAGVLARTLAGEDAAYEGSVVSTNLKVSGVHVFSAGDFEGADGTESILLADPGLGLYRRLVLRRDAGGTRLAGAVMFGDTADGRLYLDLIRHDTDIAPIRAGLAFGAQFFDAPLRAEPDLQPQAEAA